ncbi:hypothetical protein SUGI_1204230 [Cryptomeria japonica]|nr:hypothetical protein SUGI_1204230 [Cryptomeria japonica]
MASSLVVVQQVLEEATILLNFKKGFEWLEKNLRYICGYLQVADGLSVDNLYEKEWRQEVRAIVEYKADELLRLLPLFEWADWIKHSIKIH